MQNRCLSPVLILPSLQFNFNIRIRNPQLRNYLLLLLLMTNAILFSNNTAAAVDNFKLLDFLNIIYKAGEGYTLARLNGSNLHNLKLFNTV